MLESISLAVAIVASRRLSVDSVADAFCRGAVRMTQATVVFFGPDGARPDRRRFCKVFLRPSVSKSPGSFRGFRASCVPD
jgi:hypothetical protein